MNDHFKMKTTKNFLPWFVYANSQETKSVGSEDKMKLPNCVYLIKQTK